MKAIKIILLLVILGGGAGFGYLAMTDVNVQQEEQTIKIPTERFFGPSDS